MATTSINGQPEMWLTQEQYDALDKSTVPVGTRICIVGSKVEESDLSQEVQNKLNSGAEDKFVPKTNTAGRIYATDASGNQTTIAQDTLLPKEYDGFQKLGRTGYQMCGKAFPDRYDEFVIDTYIAASTATMPVVRINGYAYGTSCPYTIEIGWYNYNGNPGYAQATALGRYRPKLFLFKRTENGNTYISVGMRGMQYFNCFDVDCRVSNQNQTYLITPWAIRAVNVSEKGDASIIPEADGGTTCFAVPYASVGSMLVDTLYPVGSRYIQFDGAPTPASIFENTVWETDTVYINKFLMMANILGATGGENTHTLTESEMPNHKHTGVLAYEQEGFGITIRPGETYALRGLITSTDYLATNPANGQALTNRNERQLHYTTNTGGGAAHNNMPAYKGIHVWKREK